MNESYCLLPFSFKLKIISLISLISLQLISLFSYRKMYSRKDTSPNYIEFSKKKLGDLLAPKISTIGKFILNPVFDYSIKMS